MKIFEELFCLLIFTVIPSLMCISCNPVEVAIAEEIIEDAYIIEKNYFGPTAPEPTKKPKQPFSAPPQPK